MQTDEGRNVISSSDPQNQPDQRSCDSGLTRRLMNTDCICVSQFACFVVIDRSETQCSPNNEAAMRQKTKRRLPSLVNRRVNFES